MKGMDIELKNRISEEIEDEIRNQFFKLEIELMKREDELNSLPTKEKVIQRIKEIGEEVFQTNG